MSRTSTALKRLGVAGVAVATIGAGVPAFFATAAQAAGPTAQLTISPSTQTGASGTCLIYTVTPTDSTGATPTDTQGQTIRLTASSTSANEVQFCNPSPPFTGAGTSTTVGTVRTPATGTATQAPAGTAANTAGTQTFGVRGLGVGGATIRAFVDTNANTLYDAGEPTGTATATFTAGGLNQTDTSPGGNAAQDAVKSIAEVPQSPSANPIAAGTTSASDQYVTVQVKNANGDPVSGVNVSVQFAAGSANGAQTTPAATAQPFTCNTGGTTTTNGVTTFTASPGTTATGSQGGPSNLTNNNGVMSCKYTAVRPGTDSIQFWVNQSTGNTPGPDANEPQLTVTRTTGTAPNTLNQQARFIDLTPNGPLFVTSGGSQVFTATVTDANGLRVSNVAVTFTQSGAGRFSNGTNTTTGTTNNFGQATATLTSVPGETGQAVVTVVINNPQTGGTPECTQAAGAGTPSTSTTPAGKCSDATVVNFGAASPSPSASPTASASPPAGRQALTLTVLTPLIPAGSTGKLQATGAANQAYQLQCYTRPSTTYFTARSGSFDAAGNPVTFTLALGRNTRCFIQYATNSAQGASPSVVINVRTVLSLSTVRTGVQTYIFQGRNLPRVAGQLITLYRVDNAGNEIRTSNLVTDSTGIYRVTRKFLGTGTFQFKVRTSQTLNNAAGVSNTITVRVY